MVDCDERDVNDGTPDVEAHLSKYDCQVNRIRVKGELLARTGRQARDQGVTIRFANNTEG